MATSEGRIAVVTGANKGIGLAIARRLSLLGMCVYLGARDEQRGLAAQAGLRAEGLDVRLLPLDVTDRESVRRAAEKIEKESGMLHVLVNNAGAAAPIRDPVSTPVEEVRSVYETNVFGVVEVTNALLPLLRRSGSARIVNISSVIGSLAAAAQNTDPTGVHPPGEFPTLLAYGTSKSALNAVTLTYANALRGSGILVNAVSPGFVATDLNGHHGVLTPEDGARVPVLLATCPDDGPTGVFLGENGSPYGEELPW